MSLLRVGEAGPERLRILAGLLTLIALILGVVISLFNRKHFAKVWIFAIWVPLTIAPYAITWPIMDHFDSRSLYLPLIGLGALFGYGVSVVVNSIVGWPWLRTMNASVHLMVVAFLAALAIVPVVVANSNYLLHLQDRLLQQGKSAHQAINALVEHMPKIIEKDLVYLDMPDVFSGRSMAVVQMYVPYSVIRQDKIVINNPVYLKVLMKERHVSADRVVYLHYDGRKFQDQSSQLGLELASSFDSGTIKAVINPVLSGQQYYYPSYDAGNLNLSTINSYTCQVTSSYEPRQPTQLPAVYSDIATETLLNDSAVIKTDPDYARRTLAGYPRNISDKKSFFYLEPIMLFLQAQDEIVLDLGEVTSFEQVVWLRDLSGAYHDRVPTKVSISVSSDLKGWQSVTSNVELKDVNKLAAGLITFPKQEGRYLKLEITDSIGHLPAAYEKILVPPMSYSTLPLDQNLVDNLINPLRSFRDRATVGTIQSLKMGLIKPTLTVKDIATGTTETQTVLLPADEAQISLSSNMVSVFKINPKSFGITKWIDRLTLDFVVPPGEVTVDRLSCQP